MAGASLAYSKAKVHRLAYELDGVREWSKGGGTNWWDSSDRDEYMVMRDRLEDERIHDRLEEAEGQMDGLIGKLEELWFILETLKGKSRWLYWRRKTS